MRILLTQRKFGNDDPSNNPIAILDLAPYFRRLGHEVDSYYIDKLPQKEYDIVGLSVLNYDKQAIIDANHLRKRFNSSKIVIGGKGAQSFDEKEAQLLKEKNIEVWLKSGESYFSKDENIDYDNYPSWELKDLESLQIDKESLMTTRGCPYSCHFCHNTEKRLFFFKAQRTVDNIELLFKIGRRYVVFVDDIFTLRPQHMIDIYNECKRRKIQIEKRVVFLSHINHINDETIKAMVLFEPLEVSVGLESGDDEMLKKMGKPFTVEFAYKKIELLSKYVPIDALFLIGFPGESIKSLKNTVEFVKKIRNFLSNIWISFYNPVPKTVGYDLAKDNGLIIDKKQDNREIRYIDRNLAKRDLMYYKYLIAATYCRESLLTYSILLPPRKLKAYLLRIIKGDET